MLFTLYHLVDNFLSFLSKFEKVGVHTAFQAVSVWLPWQVEKIVVQIAVKVANLAILFSVHVLSHNGLLVSV